MNQKSIFCRVLLLMALLIPFVAKSQTVGSIPYQCNFEDVSENANWVFLDTLVGGGQCLNRFAIDTSTNITIGGTRALYITEEGQSSSAHYKHGSETAGETTYVTSRSYAYREIYFPAGDYEISYWWNCVGEMWYDYGRMVLAPTTYPLVPSVTDWDTTTTVAGDYFGTVRMPSSFIALDRGWCMATALDWELQTTRFHIETAGTYRLVVMWQNDGNTGFDPPIAIDDISIRPVSCPAPTDLAMMNLRNGTTTLTWRETGSATSWIVEWDTIGVRSNFRHTETVNGNATCPITDLVPGAYYDFFVRSVCGTGNESYKRMYRLKVPTCDLMTELPYSYDLDSASFYGSNTDQLIIPCWTVVNTSPSYPGYPYLVANQGHTGSYGLYYYKATDPTHYDRTAGICLPGINRDSIDIHDVAVRFWAKSINTSNYPRLVVGVMNDPNNPYSFQAVDSVEVGNSAIYQEFVVGLGAYTGVGNYICIRSGWETGGTYNYWYGYVDDIELLYEPCARTAVRLDSVSAHEAYFSWNRLGATSFDISVGDTLHPVSTTDTFYVVHNLSSASRTTVWFRSHCSATEQSTWHPKTFTTECALIAHYPFVEDFEYSITGNGKMPSCWRGLSNGTGTYANGGYYPQVRNNYTYGRSSFQSAYMYLYPTSNTTATYPTWEAIILPQIDTLSHRINTLKLGFYTRQQTASYSTKLFVGVMTDPDSISTFVPYDSVTVTGSSYLYHEFNFSRCTTPGEYIALYATKGATYTALCIDDLTLSLISTDCAGTTAITNTHLQANEAIFTWNNRTGVTSWDIEYGPSPYNRTGVAMMTVYDTTVTIADLISSTGYTIFVTPSCTGTGETQYLSFKTPCTCVDSLPYAMDFEGLTTSTISTRPNIPCWAHLNNGTTSGGSPYITSTAAQCFNGSRALYWNYSSLTTPAYGDVQLIVSPCIDTNEYHIGNVTVSFWTKTSSNTQYPTFEVGVMTNPHDASTFVPCQTVVNESANNSVWVELTASLSNYTGTGNYVAIKAKRAQATTSTWIAYVDSITLGYVPCPTPTPNVTTTSDSVYLTWVNTSAGYEYEIVHADSTRTFNTTTTNDPFAEEGNLLPNTEYVVYLRGLCSGDTSDWSETTFRTACSAISIPFYEDFESYTVGSTSMTTFINCWNRIYDATQYFYPFVQTNATYARSGSKALYYYHTGSAATYGTYTYLILPKVDPVVDPVNTLRLSFWAQNTSASYSSTFVVGVMTDPDSLATFVLVDTITVSGNVPTYVHCPLTSYTGSGAYVALGYLDPSGNYACYVDDIVLDYNPTCLEPTNVTVSNVSNDSATVAWSHLLGTVGNYDVIYEANGISRVESVYGDTSVILTGLVQNSYYSVSVMALCANNDSSYASTSTYFRTPCTGEISVVPYTETFDGVATHANTAAFTVPCWTRYNNGTTNKYPIVSSSTTYAHNYLYPSVNGLYWYQNSTAAFGTTNVLISPAIDTSRLSIDSLMVSFWTRATTATYTPIYKVGVMTDPTDLSTFVAIDTVVHTGGIEWRRYDVPLNTYTGNGRYLAIRSDYVVNTFPIFQAGLDDITIDYIPECIRPNRRLRSTNVTAHTATAKWEPTGATTLFYFDNDTNVMAISGDSVVIDHLMPNTTYRWWVRTICNNGDTTEASNPIIFRTTCGAIDSLPFTYGFDDLTAGSAAGAWNVPCWERINTGTGTQHYPYVSSSTTYVYSGTMGLYWYQANTAALGSTTYLVLPEIDTSVYPMDTILVSFWAKATAASYHPIFKVGVMTNPLDATTFVGVDTINVEGTVFTKYTAQLRGYNGPGRYIALKTDYINAVWYAAIDEITFSARQGCSSPGMTMTTDVTATSAKLSWANNSSVLLTYWTGSDTTRMNVSTNDIVLSSLQPNTTYSWYVQSLCASSDTSEASSVEVFTTECSSISSLPFNEGFEGYTAGTATAAFTASCWYRVNNATGTTVYPIVTAAGSQLRTGTRGLYWYQASAVANGTTLSILSRPIDTSVISMNRITVSFWVKATSASYVPKFKVGTLENGNNLASFVGVDTITHVAGTDWRQYEVSFEYYTGHANRICIKSDYESAIWYACIDDIEINALPSCPKPDNLSCSTTTPTTATISWRSNASNFLVTYTSNSGVTNSVAVTGNSTTLTGLLSGMEYTWSVKAVCSNSDTSQSSVTGRFSTTCAAITSLPYTEGFEQAVLGASSEASFQAPCWQRLTFGTTNYGIYVGASQVAHTGSRGIYWWQNSGTTFGNTQYLITPAIETSVLNLDTMQITFWVKATQASYRPKFIVGLMTDPSDASTFVAIDSVIHTDGTTWTLHDVSFAGYSGNARYVAIMSDYADGGQWIGYVDDITLDYMPACSKPMALTSNPIDVSAQLSWNTTAPNARVYYRAQDETSYHSVYVSGNSTTITGLSPLTTYYWRVRGICGANDSTGFSHTMSFTTTYCSREASADIGSETGTNSTNAFYPAYTATAHSYTQQIIDSSALAASGERIFSAIAFYMTNTTTAGTLDSCSIYIGHAPSASLSSGWVSADSLTHMFRGSMNMTPGWNFFTFDTSFVWDGVHNVVVAVLNNRGVTGTNVVKPVVSSPAGSARYLTSASAINMRTPGTGVSSTVRNIMKLVSCGSCMTPTFATTSNTYESISTSWTGSATNYEIAIKAANEPQWGNSIQVNNGYTYTFSGLNFSTEYLIRLRALCDTSLRSDWTVMSITTDSIPCATPTDLTLEEVSFTSATLRWSAAERQTSWRINMWNTSIDTSFVVNANPFTITDLAQATDYYMSVNAICGGGLIESDTSNILLVSTSRCEVPSNVVVDNVLTHSVDVSWTGTATEYELQYGERNFPAGGGQRITVNGNNYQITGLEEDTEYDIIVRSSCGNGIMSDYTDRVQFRTLPVGIDPVDGFKVSIYPNPTSTSTNITIVGATGEIRVAIIDLNGREIRNNVIDCSGNCTTTLSVSDLAAGSYFVRVSGEGVNMVRKLVVK